MERHRIEERLKRKIRKLERANEELSLDIWFSKAARQERRERKAMKYKKNFKTDVSAPFEVLIGYDDLNEVATSMDGTLESSKILTRLANSNTFYAKVIASSQGTLWYSAYTNGTIVLVNVRGSGAKQGFGIALRNSVDKQNEATGTMIALRRALVDYFVHLQCLDIVKQIP